MRRPALLFGVLALAGSAIVGNALARGGDTAPVEPESFVPPSVLGASLEKEAGSSVYRPYATVAEMLPNTKHMIPGQRAPLTMYEAVVVGRVVDVVPGTGFIETGNVASDESPLGPTLTAFDSPLAHWRTLQLTFRVERGIVGANPGDIVLDWAIMGSVASGEKADTIGSELRNLGQVVLFLDRSSASMAAPSGVKLIDRIYGIAQVKGNGALSFPFLDKDTAAKFMAGVGTVDALAAEVAKPERTKINK